MRYDPKTTEHILALLRQWGWETGLERLQAEWQSAPEGDRRSALQFFLGWMVAERGGHDEAAAQFQALEQVPGLGGWAVYGQAFLAARAQDYARAHQLLERAAALAQPEDVSLRAAIALSHGAAFHHEGKPDLALPLLHQALEGFGPDCFGTGRALDALGMAYAGRDNFHAAREFYEQAMACKRRFEDEAGLALTHGQLGRLYLDWGHLEKAEEYFSQDLEICQRIGDDRGAAQMTNHLGQVALARGDLEGAAEWLDEGIRRCQQGRWPVTEGYTHKDRALAYLEAGDVQSAAEHVQQAEDLFRRSEFAVGSAQVRRVWGMICRAQGRYDEAERALRSALQQFETRRVRAEVARTRLELARTLRARPGTPRPLLRQEVLAALQSAESCRRDALVAEVEALLKEVDEAAYCRHLYSRVRGRGIRDDSTSLLRGTREPATVLFLDLKGSTEYTRATDPEVVMRTLNQLMGELAQVLRPLDVQVNQYLGDGFMALARGADHPDRAVRAALALSRAVAEFNRPRKVLGLREFEARIGVSTGEVMLANVGTYDKMDYTAVGATTNLAARLQGEASPGVPCVSRATYERVRERIACKPDNPRTLTLKGLGACEVWDVTGHAG